MKAAVIERIKSVFVDSVMMKLDLNDFAHLSRVILDNRCSSFIDLLTQSNTLIFEKLIYQQHLQSIHLHNDQPKMSTCVDQDQKLFQKKTLFDRQTVHI